MVYITESKYFRGSKIYYIKKSNMTQRIVLGLLAFICIINSCKNQNAEPKTAASETTQTMSPLQKNIQDIEAYLESNNITAQKTDNNLYYVVTREGDGTHPTISDQVTLHYRGYTLDGNVFDASYDKGQPITYPLSGFVQGWQQGIPMFSRGGAGQLFLPSTLGYGQYPPPGSGIQPNAVLIFDVELIKINGQ